MRSKADEIFVIFEKLICPLQLNYCFLLVHTFRLYHGSSTGAISAFRGAIVTILEIKGRFYLSGGRF